MSFLFRDKTAMPEPADALPGRDTRPFDVPDTHFVLGTPARAAVPRGHRDGDLRHGLLLGRRARCSGRRPASTRPRSATPAATRRTRPTRRSAAGAPATPRSCSSSSTRRRSCLRRAAAACSGRATTRRRACARATTSAPSTARRSTRPSTPSATRAEASRETYQERAARRRLRRHHDRDRATRRPFYYAEDYHQQYLAKNPNGYCGLGGTGVSCPSG